MNMIIFFLYRFGCTYYECTRYHGQLIYTGTKKTPKGGLCAYSLMYTQ